MNLAQLCQKFVEKQQKAFKKRVFGNPVVWVWKHFYKSGNPDNATNLEIIERRL